MAPPMLAVISGPPGAGKTTLAHALAERIGCPAICRDEIKEGMVHAADRRGWEHDELNLRTLTTFFAVLDTLVRAEVSTVAEAAFQDRLWRPGLSPLLAFARVLIVRCQVTPELARARQGHRLAIDPRRSAHADAAHLAAEPSPFDWPHLDVPTLDLDTAGDLPAAVDAAAAFLTTGGTDA